MRKVRVIGRKYDGSLRDEYEAYLYEESDEAIVLFCPLGLPTYDHRKGAWFEAPDGLLEIYFKKRWYNAWHIAEPVSGLNLSYINIAMPATLRDGVLEWTDLDIDYRVHLDGRVERLDEVEFAENARRMAYPHDLIERVQTACREVEAGLKSRKFPFDYHGQVERYRRIRGAWEPE